VDKGLVVLPNANATEFLANVTKIQKILTAMVPKPPQWVRHYDWMNATIWNNVMMSLGNTWGNGTEAM
jgi:hypothetical protein